MSRISEILETHLKPAWGPRCKEFNADCPCCKTYAEAEAAINAYIAECIGEDEESTVLNKGFKDALLGRNLLRDEQRKRAGL